jgi:hypothetical protein
MRVRSTYMYSKVALLLRCQLYWNQITAVIVSAINPKELDLACISNNVLAIVGYTNS